MLLEYIEQTLMPYSVKCLRYVTENHTRKLVIVKALADVIYQLTGIRLSGVVKSQTGTYILDCCRVNGYTNS